MTRVLHPAVAVAMAAAVLYPVTSQSKELFEGKTVKVICGFAAGGGYDTYARAAARHIGRFLPGKPTAIVQNMTGAGSIAAANYIYNQAPKDGTAIATFARSLPVIAFSGEAKQVRYDPLKLTWIGTPSSYKGEAYVLTVRKDTGIKNIAELRAYKRDLRIASTGYGSDGHDVPIILRETLKLPLQVVRGYPGGNTLYLAVDRGEMDARMTGLASIKTAHREWLGKDSPVRILMQFARTTRHPELSDVPTARELASSDDDRNLIGLLEAPFFMARPFAAPPDMDPKIVKILRKAFMDAHNSPAYLKDAKKLHLSVSPMDGEGVQKVVEEIGKMPRALYTRYSALLKNPNSPLRTVKWQIVDGKISKLQKKGRFQFTAGGKTMKSRMTGGYTQVMIDGKKAKTKSIKAGMNCKIWWEGKGSYAGKMECTK
jgi:tripartite-type tricarboxylate transporter receptor subunit TctC